MITVTPQVEDAMAIIWMRRRKLYTGKAGVFMWGGTIIAIAMSAGLILYGPSYGIPDEYGYWMLGLYVWLWGVIGISYALTPLMIGRRFKKFDLAARTYTIDWDDEKVIQRDKNTKSEVPWRQFTGWREDGKLIVLVFDRIRVIYIPKRVFDTRELEDFRRLLETKIGKRD